MSIEQPIKKKLLFICHSLGGGGAEKLLIDLLITLPRENYSCELLLFTKVKDYDTELPAHINVSYLNIRNTFNPLCVLRIAKYLRHSKPDLIVSFLSFAIYLIVIPKILAKSKAQIVSTIHSNVSYVLNTENTIVRFKPFVRKAFRYCNKHIDMFVSVSKGVGEDLCSNFRVPATKCRTIYNGIDIENITKSSKEKIVNDVFSKELPLICACARLTKPKNYPLLLKSFKLLLADIDAELMILGDGELREELEAMTKELQIEDNVNFLGFQKNPYKFMASSDLFVLSSDFEGFGIAIAEAMACSLPIVSTRCPSGPGEIITDGVEGLLVPINDSVALAEAMSKVLSNETLRSKMSAEAEKRAQDFSFTKVRDEYDDLFKELLAIGT